MDRVFMCCMCIYGRGGCFLNEENDEDRRMVHPNENILKSYSIQR
ncbi:hypothetical protein F946_01885 [Acinetobacter johnsonii ANC 3681]|uniref:Uncharacterized protein n=1 Tax=Acinetobacter johnsonii ANC 3681 TaxID=1217662 RepID=N9CVF0_ACIJO|nr:hypothetical protein F946_01885 [Acinetobacter johnsonii ANC 3681]VXA83436.1 conserved hypothetical protein [Acinetobacter sp. 8I-beige]